MPCYKKTMRQIVLLVSIQLRMGLIIPLGEVGYNPRRISIKFITINKIILINLSIYATHLNSVWRHGLVESTIENLFF